MKRKLSLMLILVCLLLLASCGKARKVYPMEPDEDQRDIAVSDMLGGQLRLEEAAQRLVVLSPSACEIIADLGAVERIVASGEFCEYPKELSAISKVSIQDLLNSSRLDQLDSDLIIIDAWDLSMENIDRLYKAGRAVLLLDVKNVEDIYRSTEIIGKVLGKNLAAKELVRHMSSQWEALLKGSGGSNKGTVYIENQDIPPAALGRDTLISYFLEKLGYENILKERKNKNLTLSQIEVLKPDYILKLANQSSATVDEAINLRAVEEKNIYYWKDFSRLAGPDFVSVLKDLLKGLK